MVYKIPLFELNFDRKEEDAVIKTLRSKWISTGPMTIEFEKKFSEMSGAGYSIALANCTVALHLAMELLEIKKGDEVIVPSLTFAATVNCIRYTGAVPVFCDIKSYEDLTIDPEKIKSLITKKTKAIIVMHYAGFACDMKNILNIAKKYKLKIVEDACHGPLSEYDGKKLGTIGDIGCFSFFSNKNISTGEGGMLITNDKKLFDRAKLLRSHGMTSLSYERSKGHSTDYDIVELGYNYRMDDIRASIGIVQLAKLKKDLDKRSKIRKQYIKKLSAVEDLIIPFKENSGIVSNYIFPVILKNSNFKRRNNIREALKNKGIQTSVHYPAVHNFSFYKKSKNNLPLTEYVTDNEITLPMYGSLNKNQIEYISNSLIEVLK
ncbi:MAG: DegT/DnrJ/EryC1/StrS family aminotransferase [Ignavibacteria bacterium]